MPTNHHHIRGVLPVFQTPFHTDYSIDFTTLEREIQWLLTQGADGIVMGMVSETLRLSDDERRALAEAACHYTRVHDTKVHGTAESVTIISTGAESTHTAIGFARHAEQIGADGIMVIPPVSVAVGEGELYRYYAAIIESVDIPVVVQDASGYVGRPMSIAMQASLYNEYSDRIFFKPEATPIGPRLSALRDATSGNAPVLEGTGGIALVDSYRRRIVGTMPGADLIDVLVALWQALENGDEERVYQLSLPLSSLIAIQTSLDSFLAVEKYLLKKRGIFVNTLVRGPVGYQLDNETQAEIDRLFARLQKILG